MLSSLFKLLMGIVPVTVLLAVLGGSFWLVHSDSFSFELETPVVPQAILIEANSTGAEQQLVSLSNQKPLSIDPASVATGEAANDEEKVWQEISDTIAGLNELVGEEMFVGLTRGQKGQMEVRLNRDLWSRVRYQTRADLKTDISNLWHLYVTEFGYVDSSSVYFLDDSNGDVIDIFSKAR